MKTLIAVDSSDLAQLVLAHVCQSSWSDSVEFRLISVVDNSLSWETQQQLIHQAQIILDKRLDFLRTSLPNNSVDGSVIEGRVPEAILQEAANWKADLLVIGSHGDTGCRRAELGSVAADLVKEANCTVQVVKVCTKPSLVIEKAALSS